MILFPPLLFKIIVLGALIGVALGVIVLLTLLFRDWKKRRIW